MTMIRESVLLADWLNFANWLMHEAIDGPNSSRLPSSNQWSDLEEPNVLDQVATYVEEDMDVLEEVGRYQTDESEQEEAPRPH